MRKKTLFLAGGLWIAAIAHAQTPAPATPGRGRAANPASQRPAPTPAQVFPPEQIEAGKGAFAAQCGFCHGRDAQGAEGPDLTRSALLADDVRGDKLIPVIREGRLEKGMPAFKLSDADTASLVAFIYDAKAKAESLVGGRRTVEPSDLLTGDSEAGKAYFESAGGCAKCHSATGTFATVGARYQGLALVQRMLNPRSGRGPDAAAIAAQIAADVSVRTKAGEVVRGKLAYRDEFTISLTDSEGWNRSFPLAAVEVSGGEDPLRAHIDQLARYTDRDIHDLYAYLQTLGSPGQP